MSIVEFLASLSDLPLHRGKQVFMSMTASEGGWLLSYVRSDGSSGDLWVSSGTKALLWQQAAEEKRWKEKQG